MTNKFHNNKSITKKTFLEKRQFPNHSSFNPNPMFFKSFKRRTNLTRMLARSSWLESRAIQSGGFESTVAADMSAPRRHNVSTTSGNEFEMDSSRQVSPLSVLGFFKDFFLFKYMLHECSKFL